MTHVTRILSAIEQGDPKAVDQLLPLVYDELRKLAAARLAHEAPGQTLQPTALVHEAYLRLIGDDAGKGFDGRGHFFAAAAEAMRRILIDRARDRNRLKRGGSRRASMPRIFSLSQRTGQLRASQFDSGASRLPQRLTAATAPKNRARVGVPCCR